MHDINMRKALVSDRLQETPLLRLGPSSQVAGLLPSSPIGTWHFMSFVLCCALICDEILERPSGGDCFSSKSLLVPVRGLSY